MKNLLLLKIYNHHIVPENKALSQSLELALSELSYKSRDVRVFSVWNTLNTLTSFSLPWQLTKS
jgi:hypothetical protein